MHSDNIVIFDTTLRDGGQCRGKPLTPEEKLKVAHQLARLRVDVIEAGFPAASPDEIESLKLIASEIKECTVAGLARATQEDVEKTAHALEKAELPRIHIFVSTSKVKAETASAVQREEVIRTAVAAIGHAKKYFKDIEFSPHNATRLDETFLAEIGTAVIDAGATTLNISDTVGYAVPEQFGGLIRSLRQQISNIDQAVLSVHCHNDLGMAVANSLAAIQAGARQVECTVNGIGERAGNAAMEEIVMALRTRKDVFDMDCGIDSRQIMETSRLVSKITGYPVPRNKAIVGTEALDYDTGMFQSGFSKRESYEMIKAEDIGSQQP
jgi:2-isopropylmalate synthase